MGIHPIVFMCIIGFPNIVNTHLSINVFDKVPIVSVIIDKGGICGVVIIIMIVIVVVVVVVVVVAIDYVNIVCSSSSILLIVLGGVL
jgi:hypothetical protein